MDQLRVTEFLRVFWRPDLLMGAERGLVLLALFFSSALVVVGLNRFSIPLGIAYYFCSLMLLRKMAKLDPLLSKVWRRYMKYQAYYPAQPRAMRYIARSKNPCKV